ncbi:hypothetical protein MUP77_02905 [Candidatus Bathyarchaeota archaeon]|jgi:hypothetical protein|nr:hypothetical protein [Candidatus Bathyarchaeota archaeon]
MTRSAQRNERRLTTVDKIPTDSSLQLDKQNQSKDQAEIETKALAYMSVEAKPTQDKLRP